jgi:hypothetical protein
MQAFAQNAKRQFEAQTVRHISGFAPGQFEILGEETTRQIVSSGVERAEKYGFTNRGPVRFYIELMFMFGSDFDTDPQYAWAAEALCGSDPTDQMTRADRLHQETMRYIEMVAGPDLEYERQALNKIAAPSPVATTFSGEDTSGIAKGECSMPMNGCSSPVNPCSTEDAYMPVGHTISGGPDTGTTATAAASSDDLPKDPAVGAPEKG